MTKETSLSLLKIIIDKTGSWYKTISAIDSHMEQNFLCWKGEDIWVSSLAICAEPDTSLPKNCERGCMYVQPKRSGGVIPVDQLDEIYLIDQEMSDA